MTNKKIETNELIENAGYTHLISHKFSDIILVPYKAITNSFDLCKGNFCEMQDGIKAEIIGIEHVHMASTEASKLSSEIYNLSAWALMNQWYIRGVRFDSVYFVMLTLKKIADS